MPVIIQFNPRALSTHLDDALQRTEQLVRIGLNIPEPDLRPSESEAVTSGKVATHRMEKQSVAISAVLGIFTDLGQSELLEKPLRHKEF